MTMHELACAKINLFLHVTGKRPDDYHALESLVVFTDVADKLHAHEADTLTLTVSGPFADTLPPRNEDNLVLCAATALQQELGIRKGAALRLEKNLPVTSGMGGGSADAAAALRLLVRLWGVDVAYATLERIAGELGSDVPACLHQQPAWVTGRGEHVQRLVLPGSMHLALINPGVPVSTAEVFRRMPAFYRLPEEIPGPFPTQDALLRWLVTTHNDLQAAALSLAPQINDVLAFLISRPGCLIARMSGSGATCFGLFADESSAQKACLAASIPPGWWAKAARTGV